MSNFSIDGYFNSNGILENFVDRPSTLQKNLNKLTFTPFKSNDFVSLDNLSTPLKEMKYKEKQSKKRESCMIINKQNVCFSNTEFNSVKSDLSDDQKNSNIDFNRLKPSLLLEKNIIKEKTKKENTHTDRDYEKNFGKYLVIKKSSPKKDSVKKTLSKLTPKKKTSVKRSNTKKSSPEKIRK